MKMLLSLIVSILFVITYVEWVDHLQYHLGWNDALKTIKEKLR